MAMMGFDERFLIGSSAVALESAAKNCFSTPMSGKPEGTSVGRLRTKHNPVPGLGLCANTDDAISANSRNSKQNRDSKTARGLIDNGEFDDTVFPLPCQCICIGWSIRSRRLAV